MKAIPIKVYRMPLEMPEVRVHDKNSVIRISRTLAKPLISMDNAQIMHHGLPSSKTHSFLAVISDGVIYKYVFNVMDEKDNKEPVENPELKVELDSISKEV
jgi:hypothetical protein